LQGKLIALSAERQRMSALCVFEALCFLSFKKEKGFQKVQKIF